MARSGRAGGCLSGMAPEGGRGKASEALAWDGLQIILEAG